MSELYVHVVAVEPEAGCAWGLATRFGFELRWKGSRDSPEGPWEIDIPPGQSTEEEPVFEVVTGDDIRSFRRALNRELQRTQKRKKE